MQQNPCGIFDNETEPLFNVKPIELSSVLLDDCLFVLGTENVDNVERSSQSRGHFKEGRLVQLFIRLCDLLKQPADVKYHAIELFDVFMTEHIRYLRRYVRGGEGRKGVREADRQWRLVMKRVRSQFLLRVLSCVQIASKLLCQPSAMLTVDAMEQVLRKAGHSFGRTSIHKSELRVLDTVGHRSTILTPVVYVETLLEILGRNDALINLRALYHVALHVLDLFYLRRSRVYSDLFLRATPSGEHKADLVPVTNDLMFASTAVVSCAAYLLDPLTYTNLTQQLHSITQIPYDEIMDFTIVLVRIALSSSS